MDKLNINFFTKQNEKSSETGMATEQEGQSSHDSEIDGRLEDLGRRAYNDEFYLRYYVGHKGDYGHEFMVRNWILARLFRYSFNWCLPMP